MLTLTSETLQELDKFIQDMPVKYGLPLLNFINAKIEEQNKLTDVPTIIENVAE
jgi:hypothetical protein